MIKNFIDYIKGIFFPRDTMAHRSVVLPYGEWYLVKVALSIRIKKLRHFAEKHPDSADLLNGKARRYAKVLRDLSEQVYLDNTENTEELCREN